MRSIRREHRNAVFERLEGWWNDEVIKQLTGSRDEGIFGFEVSDKLSALSEEYKLDNLPITFRKKKRGVRSRIVTLSYLPSLRGRRMHNKKPDPLS